MDKDIIPNTAVRDDSQVRLNPQNIDKPIANKIDCAIEDIHRRITANNKTIMGGKKIDRAYCAKSVRQGLNEGGIAVQPTQHAKDYGQMLTNQGAKAIAFHKKGNSLNNNGLPNKYTPKKGDIVIIDAHKSNESGHMAIFDGEHWISDRAHGTSRHWGSVNVLSLEQKDRPQFTIYSFLN